MAHVQGSSVNKLFPLLHLLLLLMYYIDLLNYEQTFLFAIATVDSPKFIIRGQEWMALKLQIILLI